MQRQLSIFDSLQPLDTPESLIKPGDWVKLRRKTVTAPYWKKGESVQVEGVHPTNGSVKFWSERSESWAYLHPEDFTKTVQPIALDTESQPAPADTESIPAPGEFDSVSIEPIALNTESNCPHSETLINPDVEVDTESNCQHSEFDSVSGPVAAYRAAGTARSGEYFRFSYRDGKKMKHLHIPGGNTGNVLARQRAAEVMELAAAGVPAVEICDRIRSWSGRTATQK
ncbi:hypothetical protein [Microcoleus sp. AT9b-C5]|uniref:hypothetical protein n=1 Tax=unclassified Microcoleus TaxID=2642155 RepID=UPI002FD29833